MLHEALRATYPCQHLEAQDRATDCTFDGSFSGLGQVGEGPKVRYDSIAETRRWIME